MQKYQRLEATAQRLCLGMGLAELLFPLHVPGLGIVYNHRLSQKDNVWNHL